MGAMSIAKEFREFAVQGNVVDLAVGVIIGAAFGKIVTSAVEDLIMPVVGKLTGGVNFADMYVAIDGKSYESAEAARKAGAAAIYYGNFITQVIQFIILAWVIFLMVKAVNKMRARTGKIDAVAATPPDVELLTEIRDLLKARPLA